MRGICFNVNQRLIFIPCLRLIPAAVRREMRRFRFLQCPMVSDTGEHHRGYCSPAANSMLSIIHKAPVYSDD